MADINVDVILPEPISVDVSSPTQALNASIFVAGPEGPRGPRGYNAQLNNLTGDFLYISGRDGISISDNGVNTIYVSGNSGYFQLQINTLTSNLNLTGANLNNNISAVSGVLQNTINDLNNNYATDFELSGSGNMLNLKINSLSGFCIGNFATILNLNSTGSILDNKINLLSGYVDNTFGTITNLYTTGSQLSNSINSLSGNLTGNYVTKNNGQFLNRPTLNGTGFLLSGEAGLLPNTIVYTTGHQDISGIKTFTDGITIGDDVTPIFLEISGNALKVYGSGNFSDGLFVKNIPVVTGYEFLSSYATNTNLALTGSTLDNKIGSLSGNLTSTYATISNLGSTGSALDNKISSLSGNLTSTYATITNLASTGSTLDNKIGSLSGNLTSTYARITNLASTGSILDNKINSLSGSVVLKYGDQAIYGSKTFNDAVYIHDLYVTGDRFIVSTSDTFVESNFLLLNLTGGATDGGIFFVTGVGFTGVNDLGPIIGFDHSDKFKFGVARRSDDLSSLPDIASVQELRTYSGIANTTFSTISNLALTGSTLDNKIGSLSGNLTSTYATITNLASTGSALDNKISSLSGNLTSTYATISNLASTGSALDNKIGSLSGNLTSTYATITNLASTGSALDNKINTLSGVSVLINKNQEINGLKTFLNTGSFNSLQINHRKFTAYKFATTNFEINHDHIYIVNSPNNITGTILMGYYLNQEYPEIPSGINYFIKNVNNGELTITGYTVLPDFNIQPNTIDSFDNLKLYKNESVQLIGVNTLGYTGWITISADGGIS